MDQKAELKSIAEGSNKEGATNPFLETGSHRGSQGSLQSPPPPVEKDL
jgi:hypothetical protein